MGNVPNMLTCYQYSQSEEDDSLVLYCSTCKKDDYSKYCRFCYNCGDPLAVRSNYTTFTQEIPAIKFEGFQRGAGTKKFPEGTPGNTPYYYAPSIARSVQGQPKTQTIPTRDRMSIGYSLHVEGLDEEFIRDLQTKAGIVDLEDLLVSTREELDLICDKLNLSIGEKLRFRRSVMMHQNMERYSASQSEEWEVERVNGDVEESAGTLNFDHEELNSKERPGISPNHNGDFDVTEDDEDEESNGTLNFDHEELNERPEVRLKGHGDFDGDGFISIFTDCTDAEIHVGDWVKCRKNSMENWHFGQVVKKGPLLVRPKGLEDAQSFALVRPGALPKEYLAETSLSELTEECNSSGSMNLTSQYKFPPPFDQMNLKSPAVNLQNGANDTPALPKQDLDSTQYATLGESLLNFER